jgi:hypothetical protein
MSVEDQSFLANETLPKMVSSTGAMSATWRTLELENLSLKPWGQHILIMLSAVPAAYILDTTHRKFSCSCSDVKFVQLPHALRLLARNRVGS